MKRKNPASKQPAIIRGGIAALRHSADVSYRRHLSINRSLPAIRIITQSPGGRLEEQLRHSSNPPGPTTGLVLA
jgi:hypothetical protein